MLGDQVGSRFSSLRDRAALKFRRVARYGRIRDGTVADLLAQWSEAAAQGSDDRAREQSLIDLHLIPHLGHLAVAKLTTADIDDQPPIAA